MWSVCVCVCVCVRVFEEEVRRRRNIIPNTVGRWVLDKMKMKILVFIILELLLVGYVAISAAQLTVLEPKNESNITAYSRTGTSFQLRLSISLFAPRFSHICVDIAGRVSRCVDLQQVKVDGARPWNISLSIKILNGGDSGLLATKMQGEAALGVVEHHHVFYRTVTLADFFKKANIISIHEAAFERARTRARTAGFQSVRLFQGIKGKQRAVESQVWY